MAKNNYGSRRGGSSVKGFRLFFVKGTLESLLGWGSLTGRSRGRMSAWGIKVKRLVE